MNAGEPLSTRAARMKSYNELVRELDSSGAHYSQGLSEVDLTDTEDVKVLAADSNGEVLVHLGSGNYLQRYKTYVTHVQQWRQQFDKLESVDLRYDGQIIVNPDLDGMARQPALTPAAAKAAMAAGVKTAALVNYEKYVTHPSPPIPAKKDAKPKAKAGPKPVVHRAVVHRAPAKQAPVKQDGVHQAALKTAVKAAKPAVVKNTVASHPAGSVPPVAVATGQKKPSAGIQKAVEHAEDVAGIPIEHALIGIAGAHIRGMNSHGGIAFGARAREIGREEIRQAVDKARTVPLPGDREILHLLPQEFILDDQPGVQDPTGMMATRLEVRVHIVTASSSATQNLVTAVNRAGVHVDA